MTGQLEHPNIVPVHELAIDPNGMPSVEAFDRVTVLVLDKSTMTERLGIGG